MEHYIDAHLCFRNGKVELKKYSSLVCSGCRHQNYINLKCLNEDLIRLEELIDKAELKYNEKTMEVINYSAVICSRKKGQTSEVCDRTCEDCPFKDKPTITYTENNKFANLWQCCPVCGGEGRLPGRGTSSFDACDVCKGKKIISTLTGYPPQ